MKIVQINTTCGVGSTGNICTGISKLLCENNIENYILYSSRSNGNKCGIKCSDNKYIKLQALKSRVFGNYGFNSKVSTRRMIAELERINPNIIHLHNIHGHDCDLDLLFEYFKKKKSKLIWTFHDCWTFTGYCTYFMLTQCNQWLTRCSHCPQKSWYTWFFDKSSKLFDKKKKLFTDLDLTIVTPSKWLHDVVKQSFFKEYVVKTIYNGIDLSVFKPVLSNFRCQNGLERKKIVLGVADEWGERKGLDVFIRLSKILSKDYQIVLVGTNPNVDRLIPKNIISIHRTQNQKELAEIYSVADVFVNPTRDEVFGLVNVEALACGTPGITFDSGGSPECYDNSCGSIVKCDDVNSLEKEIIRICTDFSYSKEACISRAQKFDKNERFKEYLELYNSLI